MSLVWRRRTSNRVGRPVKLRVPLSPLTSTLGPIILRQPVGEGLPADEHTMVLQEGHAIVARPPVATTGASRRDDSAPLPHEIGNTLNESLGGSAGQNRRRIIGNKQVHQLAGVASDALPAQ